MTPSPARFPPGIRRLQEIVTDPILTLGEAMVSGDPQVQSAAQSAAAGPVELDDSAAPMSLEVAQLESDPITTDTFSYMAREYIWGPGDNGVDELLVQFDENGYPWWIAQDGGGDVIAEMATGSGSGAASLAAQWTYDAYGQVIAVQQLGSFSQPHAGHKGLFFDRLDAGVADAYGSELPRLAVGADLLGYNRNRTLHCGVGRFLQQDPNATGLSVQAECVFWGRGLTSRVAEIALSGNRRDGANLFAYVGHSPFANRDPNGLLLLPGLMVEAPARSGLGSPVGLLMWEIRRLGFRAWLSMSLSAAGGTKGIAASAGLLLMVHGAASAAHERLQALGEAALDTEQQADEGVMWVVRGGQCTRESFENGSGVSIDPGGRLHGVSTYVDPPKDWTDVARLAPNRQVGVTTQVAIQTAGGQCIKDGPTHATVSGLTAAELVRLFTPTRTNPWPRDQRGVR